MLMPDGLTKSPNTSIPLRKTIHNSLRRMKGFILLTFSTVDAQDSHLHISRYCQPIYFPLPYAFYMGFLSTEKTLLRTYKRG